jgi:excisionase family DNA binding protein
MAGGEADNRRATSDDVLLVEPVLLTVPEVARRLSLGRATTYLLVQRGALPVVRIGRSVRVPARALEQWVQQHTTGGEDTLVQHPAGRR